MRIRPVRQPFGLPPRGLRAGPPDALGLGDVIEPFLVSGGASYYPPLSEGFNPAPAAVQLVCYVFVPKGRVGFLKQLRVAPQMPSVFADPWWTVGAANYAASWREFDLSGTAGSYMHRPAGQNCVWSQPFGWENYFDDSDAEAEPPQWRWSLRIVQGNVEALRVQANNLTPFDPTDPATWYLVPNVAVPASAYPQGLPGASPGPAWGAQRLQVLQGDELDTHVLVPENTTLCLFAEWTQAPCPIAARDINGRIIYSPVDGGTYPLLPSFGQLHGYMQALQSKDTPAPSVVNARHGWGG